MLENKYTNCLNFEHTYYASEDFVTQLLEEHKFELIEREYFKDDHSIFFCARRTNNNNSLIKKNLYSETKATFQQYIDYHLQLVDSLNLAIRETGQPVYLFGAHIFAQYLLQFGLDESKIVCILDNDPLKQGKRLYGTSLVVESPQILKQTQAPLVILKAGFYNNEIKNQILTTINSNAIFL
jgi:FlaA1/EpsC-like NDP-sugar epimerase